MKNGIFVFSGLLLASALCEFTDSPLKTIIDPRYLILYAQFLMLYALSSTSYASFRSSLDVGCLYALCSMLNLEVHLMH